MDPIGPPEPASGRGARWSVGSLLMTSPSPNELGVEPGGETHASGAAVGSRWLIAATLPLLLARLSSRSGKKTESDGKNRIRPNRKVGEGHRAQGIDPATTHHRSDD